MSNLFDFDDELALISLKKPEHKEAAYFKQFEKLSMLWIPLNVLNASGFARVIKKIIDTEVHFDSLAAKLGRELIKEWQELTNKDTPETQNRTFAFYDVSSVTFGYVMLSGLIE